MPRVLTSYDWRLWLGVLYLLLSWITIAWIATRDWGLFFWVGVDFSMFSSAASVFWHHGPSAAYELERFEPFLQPFREYYGPEIQRLKIAPVPYPPVFHLVISLFTIFPPVISFILWTSVNAGLAFIVLRAIAQRFSKDVSLIAAVALLSFPIAIGLMVGQPIGFLLLFFYLAYRSLEQGNDFQAGLWIGLLLLKPQLGFALVLVLLLKRRWNAIGGVFVSYGLITLISTIILGFRGVVTFYSSILGYADGFRDASTRSAVPDMISWRGFVAAFGRNLTEYEGLLITVGLSIATLALLSIIWRGEWQPQRDDFALRMLATGLVTTLAGFDMHLHGAVVLVVPTLILVLGKHGPWLIPVIARLSVFVLAWFTLMLVMLAIVFVALQVLVLITLVVHFHMQQRASLSPGMKVSNA